MFCYAFAKIFDLHFECIIPAKIYTTASVNTYKVACYDISQEKTILLKLPYDFDFKCIPYIRSMDTMVVYSVTAIVCLITAVVIQRIFFKELQRGASPKEINGIKWFGWAIFIWGIGALLNLIFEQGYGVASSSRLVIYAGVVVSLLNSLFILLSLPSIEHNKKRSLVVRLVERFSEREFIIVFGVILLMIAFVFIVTSYNNTEISNTLIWLIDIPISLVVAVALLNELQKAFANRDMKFMVIPVIGLFILIVIAVTHRIFPEEVIAGTFISEHWETIGAVTSISFKFLFILLFSILLYSWKFLSEKEQEETKSLSLAQENARLLKEREKLLLANESHIDTIKSMKGELSTLKASSKIELSERQKEVLGNLGAFGKTMSYGEMAEAMHISLDGFQAHIHQIKKMLNVSGTGGKERLIAFAKANDLLRYASIKNSS